MYTHKLYSLLTENPSLASILCPQRQARQAERPEERQPTCSEPQLAQQGQDSTL